jgi:hypothetical protein
MSEEIVKKCSCCQAKLTARDIVNDPEVRPIGTTFFEDDGPGIHYYFFQHDTADCGTSFVVDVEKFRHLLNEPVPATIMTLEPGCPGQCARIDDLNSCQAECHFAPFRRFMLQMVEEKKSAVKEQIAT